MTKRHKIIIFFLLSVIVLFLCIVFIPKYRCLTDPIDKFQTLIYLFQLFTGLLLGAGALYIGFKQMKLIDRQIDLADKQIKISGIQTQINQLGLWTTRAENQRAISFNTAWEFRDSNNIDEIKKAQELFTEGNKMTDMVSKRDSETRDWIKKLNDVLNK